MKKGGDLGIIHKMSYEERLPLNTHKMKDGDYRTAYVQASRARVLLGVFLNKLI